jgi:aromatic-L-amino-acid decarboxylase
LGRRFRALKLWFVLRSYGLRSLQDKIGYHIYLANKFANKVMQSDDFELLAPVSLNLVCFRYHPPGEDNNEKLNNINQELLEKVNATGKIFISHTKLNGDYTLRLVAGNTSVAEKHIEEAWEVLHSLTPTL